VGHLSRETGLAPTTIDGRCLALRQLLGWLGAAGALRQVTATQLDKVLIGQAAEGHLSRRTVQDHASTLRAFFRFAERRSLGRREPTPRSAARPSCGG
jgi:site-specific recombinase XerD